MRDKKLLFIATAIAVLAISLALAATASAAPKANARAAATAIGADCVGCHSASVTEAQAGGHSALECVTCHEGAAAHVADTASPKDPMLYPKVHFDMEVCKACHTDQYNSFMIAAGDRTVYGGSDGGPHAPKGWSKTFDLPYWNVLIDGHPFVLETYEDRPMSVNQIEHQETIRPGSESCMACHGTKLAYYQGIIYKDVSGQIKADQMTETAPGVFEPRVVLVKGGTYLPPAQTDPLYPQGGTWGNDPATPGAGHLIYDGTSYRAPNPTSTIPGTPGIWEEAVTVTFIPNGTTVSTYIDAIDPLRPYQVKSIVTLPAAITVTVPNTGNLGLPLGTITFDTISSYPESGADINGVTGCTVIGPDCLSSTGVANVARNWVYAAMEAMAFDGLDYQFDPLVPNPETVGILTSGAYETHFSGSGANWPSIQSGELCNQCHNSHSGKPRLIKKSLIEAIAVRGINPYSPTGSQIHTFEEASRQDQIIAQCAQCHSEYVGGYSANTGRDGDYFPWAKPDDLETQYWDLFNYLQDWTHGGPIPPWQSDNANARGFTPYGQRYPIGAPSVKVQHPEAEEFLNSPMYNAGATCTDCHSARVARPDGSLYTSHWFTSPLKIMEGFTGTTYLGEHTPGEAIALPPVNPCQKCHSTDTPEQSRARILTQQDQFFTIQERTQVALVNALKYISEQKALGNDQSANILAYQRAAMRWEYYTQAENSMSFHNNPEAVQEVSNARIWVDAFIPWPLTPAQLTVTNTTSNSTTLQWYDQANDETGFIVERALSLGGLYTEVGRFNTPNGANFGYVSWTDTTPAAGTTYFYRVSAYNTAGTSVPSIWAETQTLGSVINAPTGLAATALSASQIDLSWADNSIDETGFRIERATDAAFSAGLASFDMAADATTFSDTGLTHQTMYYYRVFAVNASGTSAASNIASATTLASAPPAAASRLLIKAVGKTWITIEWKDNSNNEDGFYVERNSGTGWVRVATWGPNVTRYNDGYNPLPDGGWAGTPLARRTSYSYRIQAFNTAGTSAYSNTVTGKTR